MLRKCKTKRFSIKTAIMIGMQLVDRLQDLHGIGFLHLDIKPDNILLGSADRSHSDSS
jgi:serine/threonine protein kinase